MHFDLNEDQQAMRAEIIAFARNELNEDMIARDKEGRFSRDAWKKCAEFGVLGFPFPSEFGGSDGDIVTTTMMMEALGYGSKDAGLLFSINAQMWSVMMPILRFGNDEQKRRYLPSLCNGEMVGAHGMSEPDSGSDAFNMRATARKEGDNYVINGVKTWCTNAPVADTFIVFANTDKVGGFMGVTAFIIDIDTPGLRVSKEISKMGLKTSPMGEVILEDCVVPLSARLGKERQGAKIFNDSMEWERACILGSNLGAMQRQLEVCVQYANDRQQFRKPISQFQSVSNKIVDMKVRLETSRWLLYKVAWAKQNSQDATMDAAIAKLYLSEAWVQSCLDAIQIHGGYGYTTEYELERDLRDAVGGKLYSGTSEIQRNIIARALGL
jgi:alkylation response protein AidB-like acyl-CoA dehydrogenase